MTAQSLHVGLCGIVDIHVCIVGANILLTQIHADEDDLGKGSFADSTTTGHAGARVGCCKIESATASTLNNPSSASRVTVSILQFMVITTLVWSLMVR
jgi:hypothetical protein